MTVATADSDITKIFLVFLSFQGDVQRTAHACDTDVATVRQLAVSQQWDAKIQQFAALREQDQNDEFSHDGE
jgi:hypothetical protein